MTSLDQVQTAIRALERQRALIGDGVARTALAALREQLATFEGRTAPAPRLTSQRKQVTVLFASVAGFTSLAEALPHANVLGLMNLFWGRLDEAVTAQGGVVDKHMGDSVMAVFGAPQAHEDDPDRALRAALAMRAALADFVQELSRQARLETGLLAGGGDPERLARLQMQIGVNTGLALLGAVGSAAEYTVMGDAVNVASRLERAAPPGAILISQAAYQLTHAAFLFEELGPIQVKGKREPVIAYRLLRPRPSAPPPAHGVHGIKTAMVGRDAELARLAHFLQTAVDARRLRLVTVLGEAGVGKSRLLHEFNAARTRQTPPFTLLHGRCEPRLRPAPYALLRDLFTNYCGIQDDLRAALAQQKLLHGLADLWGRPPEEAAPRVRAIGRLIGLDTAESLPSAPTQARAEAFAAAAELLTDAARRRPLLLALEDLHWADDGSLDFLIYLAQRRPAAPLLLLCLARPALLEQRPDWPRAETPHTHLLPLHPLPQAASESLVRAILRELPHVPPDLVSLVTDAAAGNPYYVEELIKALIDDGVITAGPEGWRLQQAQLPRVRAPATLTGVIQARLDRLSYLERTLLQRAAVIGRTFWDSAVQAINAAAHQPFPAAQIAAGLRALEQREMIFRLPDSDFAGQQAYLFKHAMLREVAYESVLLRERPLYHRQAARWLAAQSGDRLDEYAALIAEHYELAGEAQPAAEMYARAADRAADLHQPDEAILYYRKVLAFLAHKPHLAAWQLRVQERLGALLWRQARLVEALQNDLAFLSVAKQDGDLLRQARAWNRLAALYEARSDPAEMLNCAVQAEQAAWLIGADTALLEALLAQGRARLALGQFAAARETAERAEALAARLGTPATGRALDLLCAIHRQAGREAEAQRCLAQLAGLAQEPDGGPLYLPLGLHYRATGETVAARRALATAVDRAREAAEQDNLARALHALGESALAEGAEETAVAHLREAVALADAVSHTYAALHYRTALGEALLALGDPNAARDALAPAQAAAADPQRMEAWAGRARLERVWDMLPTKPGRAAL